MKHHFVALALAASTALSPLGTGSAAADPAEATVLLQVHMDTFPCPAGSTCNARVVAQFPEMVVGGSTSWAALVLPRFSGVISYTDNGCVTGTGNGGLQYDGAAASTGVVALEGHNDAHVLQELVWNSFAIGWERHGLAFVLRLNAQYVLKANGHVVIGWIDATGPGVGATSTPQSVAQACALGGPGLVDMVVMGAVAGA